MKYWKQSAFCDWFYFILVFHVLLYSYSPAFYGLALNVELFQYGAYYTVIFLYELHFCHIFSSLSSLSLFQFSIHCLEIFAYILSGIQMV